MIEVDYFENCWALKLVQSNTGGGAVNSVFIMRGKESGAHEGFSIGTEAALKC